MVGGILEAIKMAGKEGMIKVISFDGSKFGVNLILDGKVIADVAQFPVKIGQTAAQTGMDVFSGKVKADSVPRFIDVGTTLITPDNAKSLVDSAF